MLAIIFLGLFIGISILFWYFWWVSVRDLAEAAKKKLAVRKAKQVSETTENISDSNNKDKE